ncbi:MAG TPA: tetratricopeptide repeat protein [Terriglobales bacterium]|nr:tetratricopeptide repeat protein [Terriglobales bacterium]
MALGFGFNKAKVLASAEKHVQQGKIPNAIAEYEKIIEKDPKDLTVLNTIGDLYARLGQPDKAGDYFKRVGDAYASDGFTVKAIAMYKKLTKLNPSATASLQKLAELYTTQGLYTDARAQYMQLADHFIKGNDHDGAIRVFQKMLEMDPDNVALQSKLADLYQKMGRKKEAGEIYQRAAASLQERGSSEAAEQALARLLALEPGNIDALFMRGKVAMDLGDGESAVKYLEQVPDIDSRLDGLQALLKARVMLNQPDELEPIARKLLTVHNDVSGIRVYADWLTTHGQAEKAIAIYSENAERLLAADSGQMIFSLQGLVSQLKDEVPTLEQLRDLFLKADFRAHIPEINELLAHALVKAGELARARDLYQELAKMEPENPAHLQNYRQVMAKLGEDAAARPLAPDEAEQAFFVEELDPGSAALVQDYPPELADAIHAALTDAELFDSYNKPLQALPQLEDVLRQAPKDARVNQRLAAVYAKAGRLEDAAACCDVLSQVYRDAGRAEEARQYAEMAGRYRQRLGISKPKTPPAAEKQPVAESKTPAAQPSPPMVKPAQVEAKPEQTKEPAAAVAPPAMPAPATPVAAAATSVSAAPAAEPVVPPAASAQEAGEAHEIDLSEEWEAAVMQDATATAEATAAEVESSEKAPEAPPEPAVVAAQASPAEEAADAKFVKPRPAEISDLLEEIRFYLSQSMWEEARSAISRCEEIAPEAQGLEALKQELEAGSAAVPEPEVEVAVESEPAPALAAEEQVQAPAETRKATEGAPKPEPTITAYDFDSAALAAAAPEPVPTFEVLPAGSDRHTGAPAEFEVHPPVSEPAVSEPVVEAETAAPAEPEPAAQPQTTEWEVEPAPAQAAAEPVAEAPTPEEPAPTAIAAHVGTTTEQVPVQQPEAEVHAEVNTEAAAEVEPEPVPQQEIREPEAEEEAEAEPAVAASEPEPEQVAPPEPEPVPAAAGHDRRAPGRYKLDDFVLDLDQSLGDGFSFGGKAPRIPPPAAPASVHSAAATATAVATEVQPEVAVGSSVLSDLFEEFKEEVEQEGTKEAEDPETHYNLGVAFKEMGLLDEAIGELQKVCKAIEHGVAFPHTMQAYTWLAQCFMEKGVPEASIKWYEKALQIPSDADSRLAVHYELASAYEAAGERTTALRHFMEVYGTNIDYRDVAQRIKALKS